MFNNFKLPYDVATISGTPGNDDLFESYSSGEQMSLFIDLSETGVPSFSISQDIIDGILIGCGNEPGSILRIISFFKKDYPEEENIAFLADEYSVGGRGVIIGKERFSLWFDENGIRIAKGDTVRVPDVHVLTWQAVAKRIHELLDSGGFASQDVLDKADSNEYKELAEFIWFVHQDLAENIVLSAIDPDIFLEREFPESTSRLTELLVDPGYRHNLKDCLLDFSKALDADPSLLLFNYTHYLFRKAINLLIGLDRKQLMFSSDKEFPGLCPSFITQDIIDCVIFGGSNTRNGKFRIYSYFLKGHSMTEKADFLKKEYGTGGSYCLYFGCDHNSSGLEITYGDIDAPGSRLLLSWPEVSRHIGRLISQGVYMGENELDEIPAYEKSELAREIYHFYTDQPEEVVRPYPDKSYIYDAIENIAPQLGDPSRVAEIIKQMSDILKNTAKDDRYYKCMERAFTDIKAFQEGRYSLFGAA